MNRGTPFEYRASRLLQSAGLSILERNFSCKVGEIDLVCRDGDTLVFVEVRARSHPHFASAAASVTPAKQRRLVAAAQRYLQLRGLSERLPCRFDVVAFDGSQSGPEDKIQWLKNAIGT